MGGGKKRIPSLYPIILMIVFLPALLLFGARVRADDGTGGEDAAITVTMPVEISLTLDTSDSAHPVFSGSGEVYGITGLAASHRYVTVTLPETFEMETPAGTKDAPDGTSVVYEGSLNGRKGYENYKAKNGLMGMGQDDIRMGEISVEIPLTADFVTYGEGDYSLTIPVTFTVGEAYGSYSEDYDFTPWADLLSEGSVTMEDGSITRITKQDCYLEIEPGITGMTMNAMRPSSYREVWIPNSVTSADYAFCKSTVETVIFEEGFERIPEGICSNADNLVTATIPEGVKVFGNRCFNECENLSDITLPKSAEAIESSAFFGCKSLKELTVRSNLTYERVTIFNPFTGAGLEDITFEEGVTEIGDYLFYGGCSNLTELTLPSTMERLGANNFEGAANLKELTIRPVSKSV